MADKENKKAKKTKTKKVKKDNFFKSLISELKKVVYPTPKAVVKNTMIVIIVVLIVGVLVALLDWGFGAGRDALFTITDNSPQTEQTIPAESVDTNGDGVIDENDVITIEGDGATIDADGNLVQIPTVENGAENSSVALPIEPANVPAEEGGAV
jgi:preprotein translocase SecE subunit